MNEHTPGPWVAGPSGPVMRGYSQPFGVSNISTPTLIAGVFGDVRGGESAAEANAHLIAAAPDLLAAAQAVFEYCPCDHDINAKWEAAWNKLVAAIKKAEGR